MAATIRWQRQRLGRGSLPPQDLGPTSSGALQDTAFSWLPGCPSSLTDLLLDELKSPGEKARINSYLTLWLRTATLLVIKLNGPINGPSVTVSHLGEGTTAALTSGWEGPLTVQGNHSLVTRCRENLLCVKGCAWLCSIMLWPNWECYKVLKILKYQAYNSGLNMFLFIPTLTKIYKKCF